MVIRRTVTLLILAVVAAWIHGMLLPKDAWKENREAGVTWEDTVKFEGILWVDARSAEAYAAEHYAGAVNLTESNWEDQLEGLLLLWSPDDTIVVYCDGSGCETSRAVALRLRRELGLDTVYWLEGGWEFLKGKGAR